MLAALASLLAAAGLGCARGPGTVVVLGTGADNYYVAERTGERDLTGYRRTGAPVELLPGTYVVRLGPRRLPVQVRPGVQTAVGP